MDHGTELETITQRYFAQFPDFAFDVVLIDHDGRVTRKDTYIDTVQMNAALAGRR